MQPNTETTPRATPPTRADEQLATLRNRIPGWHPWYVRNYQGDHTWCAMPEGALTGELQAHSPDALTHDITQFEATLDAHMTGTRQELATLPDRPETPDRRRILHARLEALLRLQARPTPT
jgi:hypothetical protein